MVQRGNGAGLALEALDCKAIAGQFLRDELERYGSSQARVFGAINHAHAALPEGGEDAVGGIHVTSVDGEYLDHGDRKQRERRLAQHRVVKVEANHDQGHLVQNPQDGERRLLGLKPGDASPTLYRPGPEGSGFRGRTGIYELVIVDDQMRTMIHDEAAEHELERYARTMTPSIRADGLDRVLRGDTTIEEVLRVTRED